ncbi:MAG: DNA-directed RNA polymerase subunit alpha [Candidatus Cloacimonetes bacterium]|nr:DNA-directed RNA polymerase subunit alpha [Candidatus Cloacimonadota bacterium]
MKFIEPLQLPNKVKIIDEVTYTQKFGKFEIGPLESGYGTTIGNTLRRVLLSSIQGAAVRFVKIEGLHHEYISIPGTDSDYIDVILRIKKIIFKSDTINEVKLTLEHKGIGRVTAADIVETADIKVVNKDLYLFDITEDIDFTMELWVGSGRGFVPSEKHEKSEDKSIGVIPIDSIYSPITKVNFFVEDQRVGEKINFDKLIIEVNTDGSIDPKDSLYLSAKLLRDLYDTIVLFENEPEYIEEIEMDPELESMEKLLGTNVNELELSVRCSNCLSAAKIETIGELVGKSENEMLKYRNFGKKSLEEINALLEKYDMHLAMNIKEIYSKIEEARNKVLITK